MSKKVRLEVPLQYKGEHLPRLWLKIVGNETESFVDVNCTVQLPVENPKLSIDVNVPDDLHLIRVYIPSGLMPVDYISMSWAWLDKNYDLTIPGLQKLRIIFDDRSHDIPVYNQKPDRNDWVNYSSIENQGRWLFPKKWVLFVSTFEESVAGTLYISSKSIEQ